MPNQQLTARHAQDFVLRILVILEDPLVNLLPVNCYIWWGGKPQANTVTGDFQQSNLDLVADSNSLSGLAGKD
jgi:hypothetical protein